MHPIITAVRHTLIRGLLAVSSKINMLTDGKLPHFMFADEKDLTNQKSTVRVTERTDTSVTLTKFNPDGTPDGGDFKILTATDLHLCADDEKKKVFVKGYILNRKTVKNFIRAVKETRPDLVVLTGDVILSDCQQIDAVQFSRMMEKLGVYWCCVFGNHEAREEKEYFKYLLYKGLSVYPHCIDLFGDPSLFGYGNFRVDISDGSGGLHKSLFLFDSGRNIQNKVKNQLGLPAELNGYDFIKPTQIEWYDSETKKLKQKYGENIKTICYMHIPLPEFEKVFDWDEDKGATPSGNAEIMYGWQYESVGCSPYNSGLFDAGKKNGTLQAVFAGHDHVNDFCAKYDGVYLVYTQCTGYNTYSMAEKADWDEKDCRYGTTLTVLHPDGSIDITPKPNNKYLSEENNEQV